MDKTSNVPNLWKKCFPCFLRYLQVGVLKADSGKVYAGWR